MRRDLNFTNPLNSLAQQLAERRPPLADPNGLYFTHYFSERRNLSAGISRAARHVVLFRNTSPDSGQLRIQRDSIRRSYWLGFSCYRSRLGQFVLRTFTQRLREHRCVPAEENRRFLDAVDGILDSERRCVGRPRRDHNMIIGTSKTPRTILPSPCGLSIVSKVHGVVASSRV